MLESPAQLRVASQDKSETGQCHGDADPIKASSPISLGRRHQGPPQTAYDSALTSLHEVFTKREKVIKIAFLLATLSPVRFQVTASSSRGLGAPALKTLELLEHRAHEVATTT
jgi:hypothetical protein